MKPGDEAVFRLPPGGTADPLSIIPKDNEIVIIEGGPYADVWYDVQGYRYAKNGELQEFHARTLHPLITDAELASELASIPEHTPV